MNTKTKSNGTNSTTNQQQHQQQGRQQQCCQRRQWATKTNNPLPSRVEPRVRPAESTSDGGVHRYDGFGHVARIVEGSPRGNFCAVSRGHVFHHRVWAGPETFRRVRERSFIQVPLLFAVCDFGPVALTLPHHGERSTFVLWAMSFRAYRRVGDGRYRGCKHLFCISDKCLPLSRSLCIP